MSSILPTQACKPYMHRAVRCTHLLLAGWSVEAPGAGPSAPDRLPRGLACLTVRLHPHKGSVTNDNASCTLPDINKAARWAGHLKAATWPVKP